MKKRLYFPFLWLILCFFQSCSPAISDQEIKRWQQQAENITIYRDDFGVPHVYGKTDADAVFGMLYAQCEDDFARVEQNYIWAIGRLAEVEGEEALSSDIRVNLFMTVAEAKLHYESSPEWLKKLCVAFADGVNYYLYTHPEVIPRLLTRFEPWMPFFFSEGSIGGDIERVSVQGIREFYENKGKNISSSEELGIILKEPAGSNGFAIAGSLTQSGKAMLLINPHTSFFFRGEMHVVSEEGLNAYGAVTWGQFFIYQGFNEKTGWMHTSSYADVVDEFMETEAEIDGVPHYVHGDELKPFSSFPVTLKVKSGDELEEKSITLYRSHHGPITHEYHGKWVATAMMWKPEQALIQSFLRTKMTGYNDLLAMMDFKANSSNNTVYADADGNIAYFHGNFIPKRNVKFDYNKLLDGSDSDTDWEGLHEVSELIQLKNPVNGWIQNCNSTPFSAAMDNSPKPEDYPYYMAPEPENFRGLHAQKVLKGSKDYTLDQLIEVAYDPYLPAFEKLIPGLVAAYDQSGKQFVNLENAIEVLRTWDMKTTKSSVAMTLAHFYLSTYLQKGARPAGMSMVERVNYFGTDSDHTERLSIFNEVVGQLIVDFGTWEMPWGEVNQYQRLDGKVKQRFDDSAPSIPVGLASGNWGALASFGSRGKQGTKKIYGTYGNSFVAVVEFGDRVSAKSILAGGQSSDPNSIHFSDQAQRYADVQFKDVAFYRGDVEKRALKQYKPGGKY